MLDLGAILCYKKRYTKSVFRNPRKTHSSSSRML